MIFRDISLNMLEKSMNIYTHDYMKPSRALYGPITQTIDGVISQIL